MPYYVYAWTGSILLGFYAIVAKLTGKYQMKNVAQFSFFATLLGGFITITTALFNGAKIPSNWTFVILAGMFLVGGKLAISDCGQKIGYYSPLPIVQLKNGRNSNFGIFFLG